MRLLIVEDNEDEIGIFAKELGKNPTIEVTIVRSRDAALSKIKHESYDLVIADLKIPTVDGGLDSDLHHGLAVHSKLREVAHGTPAVIFSGFGTVPLVSEIGDKSDHEDIWGTGKPQPLTCFKDKSQFVKCLEHIRSAQEQHAVLGEIEISFGATSLDLDRNQKLVLRIFARLYRGANIRVERLGGGLSSAQTFRVSVQDGHGSPTSYAAAKLGPLSDVERERVRYEQYVAPIVPVGGFAPVSRILRAGAAGLGGLFYALAKDYDSTLADLLRTNPAAAAAVVDKVRSLEEHWQSGAHVKKVQVGEIRGTFIDDATMGTIAAKLGFDRQALEKMEVRVKWCTQHRDLHGLNVLLKNQKEPLLIDFGEVGEAPASLDPLILELSLLFHPECKKLCGSWPPLDQAAQWDNLHAYIVNCPFPAFITECRKWAADADAGDKGMYASAYSFAVRQLKYPDTNHDLAVAIAQAAYNRLTAK